MDNCSALLARAAQCRRLAATVTDLVAIQALQLLASEFEDQAAEEATSDLAANDDGSAPHYAISRVQGGWLVSRGGDRIAVRPTLQTAREDAIKLKAFDDVD